MDLLQRLPFPLPRRLAARVWLVTLPSALLSFERRQHLPRLPIGRGRFLGLALIAAGAAAVLRAGRSGSPSVEAAPGVARLRERPAVAGGLVALGGAAVLLRSLLLAAYAIGLAFAFTRDAVDLEEPQLPHPGAGDEPWELDETLV